MEFIVHQPSRILQPFIQCYVEGDFRNNSHEGENPMFPNGYSGMFFNFNNYGTITIKETFPVRPVTVFGQIDQHYVCNSTPGYYSLGILMKPTVLSWLLRVNMAELTNKVLDGTIFNREFSVLHALMLEAPTTKRKLEILEDFFTGFLLGKANPNNIVDYALNILHNQEVRSMSTLAGQLSISQRHLETQFKKIVGLSPKTYSLILRFKRMEHQFKKMSTVHWPDMTFAAEYYDQTHFIKDFKRFTGHTPSEYLLENFELGRSFLKAQ